MITEITDPHSAKRPWNLHTATAHAADGTAISRTSPNRERARELCYLGIRAHNRAHGAEMASDS